MNQGRGTPLALLPAPLFAPREAIFDFGQELSSVPTLLHISQLRSATSVSVKTTVFFLSIQGSYHISLDHEFRSHSRMAWLLHL